MDQGSFAMPVQTDQLASEIRELRSQLGDFRGDTGDRLGGLTASVEGLRQTVGGLTDDLKESTREIIALIRALEHLRGQLATVLGVMKWAVGVSVPIAIALVGYSFAMTAHTAKLEAAVQLQGGAIERLQETFARRDDQITELLKKLKPAG